MEGNSTTIVFTVAITLWGSPSLHNFNADVPDTIPTDSVQPLRKWQSIIFAQDQAEPVNVGNASLPWLSHCLGGN